MAIDTSRLLRESDRRLAEQRALLKAGEALTSDLRFDVVIERLVSELRALVNADAPIAGHCSPAAPSSSAGRCSAFRGRRRGRSPSRDIGEAITTGKPAGSGALRRGDGRTHLLFARSARARVYSPPLQSIAYRLPVSSTPPPTTESTRQAQVERGFYRIAAVLSEPLSAEATHDAVAQAAAEALGGDSAAVLRARRGRARARRLARARRAAHRLPPGDAAALTACARGGKVLASRRLLEDSRFGDGPRRAPRKPPAEARCSRYPCRSRRATASGSCSSSSRAKRCSTTSSSRWPRRSPARRAGPWSEASCTSASAARERWRSDSLGPGGSSPASSTPTTCSTRSVRHAVQLLERRGCLGAPARRRRGGRALGRDGAGRDDALGTRAPSTAWLVGDIVQTRSTRCGHGRPHVDPRLGEADPMLAAGYAAYLGVPMIGPEESVQGILAVY